MTDVSYAVFVVVVVAVVVLFPNANAEEEVTASLFLTCYLLLLHSSTQ